jgi:menaquinone-dependent protoporphyrinogen IX oxidase
MCAIIKYNGEQSTEGLRMKGVVLYISKCGSTKQYAEWIGEETGFPIIDLKKEKKPDLENLDTVVIGSWILAGKMVAHGWIKKNWPGIRDKKVIVFSVSGDVPDEEKRKKFLEASLPGEIGKMVSFHSLHGRFRKEDQNIFIRGMLNLAAKFEKDGNLANDMVIGVDGVKRENIKAILDDVNGSS